MFYWLGFIVLVILIMIGFYVYKRMTRILKYANIRYKKIIMIMLSVTYVLLCLNIKSVLSLFLLHLAIITLLLDFIAYLFHIKSKWIEYNVISLLLSILMIGYGIYNIQTIEDTNYTIYSSKITQDYKILLLSDIHYDTIQDTKVVKKMINQLKDTQYDFIVLGGDIVEEGTSKEKMEEIFSLLGTLNHQYGIYYTYGNHDLQLYASNRQYTIPELMGTVKNTGIYLLDDEAIEINKEIELIGRRDTSLAGRNELQDFVYINEDLYNIVLDHQPKDYTKNAKLGIDLELSGHTHGGQIFPLGYFIEFMLGPNYGKYHIDQFNGIVSSGVAGWGFPVRTQKHCEYVEINLVSQS